MPEALSAALPPRFFGRRRGKRLRTTAQGLVETLLPSLSFSLPPRGQKLDPATLFTHPPRQIWLEIGFGGGEHLAWQAAQNPRIGFIGAEVFLNGIASLLGHVDAHRLDNIRVYAEDVRQLLPHLPACCLSRVFILFPDPWPKSRHEERRFVHDRNLDLLAPLMSSGALLRIATDHDVYKQWARSVMAGRADFRDVTIDAGCKPEAWPTTRYEAKAAREGRTPIFLTFQRL